MKEAVIPPPANGYQKQNLSDKPVCYTLKQKWGTVLVFIDEEGSMKPERLF